MKKAAAFLLSLVFLLSGCQAENKEFGELSFSHPWNNGLIIENENGYFLTLGSFHGGFGYMYTEFYDKNSGKTMMLCNKPECAHDGHRTCPATYKSMEISNVFLYENSLYFIGTENTDDNINVNLFRAATDGSAIDKVKTLMSCKNKSPGSHCGFHQNSKIEIKDGFVYANYGLETGEGFGGFVGREMDILNLKNNSVKRLNVQNDYFGDGISDFLVCGKYIMVFKYSGSGKKTAIVRMNAEGGEETEFPVYSDNMEMLGYDDNRIYFKRRAEPGEKGRFIFAVDPETFEITEEINITEYNPEKILSYGGKLYVIHAGNPMATVYENGKELLTFDFRPAEEYMKEHFTYIAGISDNKLYVLPMNEGPEFMYSCSLDRINEGSQEWEKLFNAEEYFKGFIALYSEGE